MKKSYLLLILFCFGLKTMGQNISVDNDSVFILIDPKYNELYSFSKKSNRSLMIKILKYDKRGLGFETQTKEPEDHEIVVVTAHPYVPHYYEFDSYQGPKEIQSTEGLKLFSIEDVSRHDKNVWRNYRAPFFFIEKLHSGNCRV